MSSNGFLSLTSLRSSSVEVLRGSLETLLHNRAGLGPIVFFATESIFLVEGDTTLAHCLAGVDLLHQGRTI
jgi:hypothetical protein